jgi:hypothetical protein
VPLSCRTSFTRVEVCERIVLSEYTGRSLLLFALDH